jgi:LPS-assembly protein
MDEAAAYGQRPMTRSSDLARCHGVILLVLQCLCICSVAVQAAEPPTPVYIQADYMERRPARNLLRFQGMVDIKYGDSHLTADTVELNTETGDGIAEGHVHFEDPKEQLEAERAEFNLYTRLGTLYQATGALKGKVLPHQRGAAPQPVTFYLTGERVVRETEDRFHVQKGSLTTCVGPSPGWQFKARDSSIEIEGYAHLRDATFWIRNIPVFYTPYVVFPTATERATGFLPPAFGTSGVLGFFLENRFFWAINEQSDSTIGVDYLSRRGIRPSLEYRYVLSEEDRGQFNGIFLDDNLTGKPFWKLYGTSQQKLPGEVQGILSLDLVSRDNYDRTFELGDLLLRTRREANSLLSLNRNWDNLAVGLQGQQLVDVENRADEQLVRYPEIGMRYLPTLLPWGALTFDLDASATNFRFDRISSLGGNINRHRFNLQPQLAWTSTVLPWLSITPFLGLNETLFDQAGAATEAQSVALLGAEVRGPQLFKIYGEGETSRYKHILEPSLTYTWIPHFTEKTRSQPLDAIDDIFPRNDVALNLTNHILTRTANGDVREFALLRVSQGLDMRGQKGAEFTRIAPGPFFADLSLEATVQPTSGLTLKGNVAYDYDQHRFDAANARLIVQPLSFLTLSLDQRFRRAPDVNFINGGVGLSLPGGWSVNYGTGFNARDNAFAGNTVAAIYRSDCWNMNFTLLQRQNETRFVFQIGLDAFLGPKVGF